MTSVFKQYRFHASNRSLIIKEKPIIVSILKLNTLKNFLPTWLFSVTQNHMDYFEVVKSCKSSAQSNEQFFRDDVPNVFGHFLLEVKN